MFTRHGGGAHRHWAARQKDREAYRKAQVEARLAEVRKAIAEGKAYLDTSWGRRQVTSYDPSTGNAVTNNTGDPFDQRTFLVCLDAILIDP
jgi:hypothetical protein